MPFACSTFLPYTLPLESVEFTELIEEGEEESGEILTRHKGDQVRLNVSKGGKDGGLIDDVNHK